MADEPKNETTNRKAVGIYDRPASADFPKRAILIVAIIIVIAIAAYFLMRSSHS
jgi:hypothetical protein